MERIPASERTRENLKALMRGRSEIAEGVRNWCAWRRG
jgi:hypothetical protein